MEGEAAKRETLGADTTDVFGDYRVDPTGSVAVERCEAARPGMREVDA